MSSSLTTTQGIMTFYWGDSLHLILRFLFFVFLFTGIVKVEHAFVGFSFILPRSFNRVHDSARQSF